MCNEYNEGNMDIDNEYEWFKSVEMMINTHYLQLNMIDIFSYFQVRDFLNPGVHFSAICLPSVDEPVIQVATYAVSLWTSIM